MAFLCFIWGIIIGSFYNVVIYRVPLDHSIIKGRSHCPQCGAQLAAIDLIPVFSQLFLRNRCRYCRHKISLRYPIVELTTGLLFMLSYLLWGIGWEFFLYLAFWSMLLITFLIDLDHMVIIDQILLFFSLIALAYAVFSEARLLDHISGLAVGFGIYLFIYLVVRAIYKREAFGFGDVLLMGSVGLFLGPGRALLTSMLSFFVAVIGIVCIKMIGGKISRELEIPFGPYICIAALLASIWGEPFIRYYLGLFY